MLSRGSAYYHMCGCWTQMHPLNLDKRVMMCKKCDEKKKKEQNGGK